MRIAIGVIAGIALSLFGFCEVAICPVAWWLYLLIAVLFAAALLRRGPTPGQIIRVTALLFLCAVMAVLYFGDWTSRKPFLRDLDRVKVGMNQSEVMSIMGRYMQGTGWPALGDSPGKLVDSGNGNTFESDISPSGELTIKDSIVFRHSNEGSFNSDWGIVSFSDGKVVRVEFSPD